MKVEILKTLKDRRKVGKMVWRRGEVLTDPIPKSILLEVEAGASTVRVLDGASEMTTNVAPEIVNEKPQQASNQDFIDPKLEALIEAKGSIAETARTLKVSPQTITNWRKGKPRPGKDMRDKISRALRRLNDDRSRTDNVGDSGSQGVEQQPS